MTFDSYPEPRVIAGLHFRRMSESDADAIMSLQSVIMDALPDRSWYYPSPKEMFADCCKRGETFGYFDGAKLAGFATLTPWYIRNERCYAAKIGEATRDTYDFQDVMVNPAYRRRGIHSAFLELFEQMARDHHAVALYCTIAPDNRPSVSSFEKAGFVCVKQQPAYEGLWRGYYRKILSGHSQSAVR